mmetsp:Transcript_13941/g.48549  ORF Transcript_13941/g.48549 Transcript_13941/m.48549 type:complete len:450 (+) Transcript_13941:1075-2424(+)
MVACCKMPPTSATTFFSPTSQDASSFGKSSSNHDGHELALATRRSCSSSISAAVRRWPTGSSNRMPSMSRSRPAALRALAKPPVPFHCTSYSEILSASSTREDASAPSDSSLASGFSQTSDTDVVADTTRMTTGRSMRRGRGAEIVTSAGDVAGSDSPAMLSAATRMSDRIEAGSMRSEAGIPAPPPMMKWQRPALSALHVAMTAFSRSLTRYLIEYAVTGAPPLSVGGRQLMWIVPLSLSASSSSFTVRSVGATATVCVRTRSMGSEGSPTPARVTARTSTLNSGVPRCRGPLASAASPPPMLMKLIGPRVSKVSSRSGPPSKLLRSSAVPAVSFTMYVSIGAPPLSAGGFQASIAVVAVILPKLAVHGAGTPSVRCGARRTEYGETPTVVTAHTQIDLTTVRGAIGSLAGEPSPLPITKRSSVLPVSMTNVSSPMVYCTLYPTMSPS